MNPVVIPALQLIVEPINLAQAVFGQACQLALTGLDEVAFSPGRAIALGWQASRAPEKQQDDQR